MIPEFKGVEIGAHLHSTKENSLEKIEVKSFEIGILFTVLLVTVVVKIMRFSAFTFQVLKIFIADFQIKNQIIMHNLRICGFFYSYNLEDFQPIVV